MINYDNVIRKRLRLKRHPEIAPHPERVSEDRHIEENHQLLGDATVEKPIEDNESGAEQQDRLSPENTTTERSKEKQQIDPRTEAEKKFDQVAVEREEERMRNEASKSYRARIDVSCIDSFHNTKHSLIHVTNVMPLLTPTC